MEMVEGDNTFSDGAGEVRSRTLMMTMVSVLGWATLPMLEREGIDLSRDV